MTDNENLEANLDGFLREESVSSEQREFNDLSANVKLERLNRLIKQTEVYSQIILDNMLEKSLEKKKLQKRQDKLKRRADRKQAREKYEEDKKNAEKAGKEAPKQPEILDSESESDLEPEDEQPEEEPKEEDGSDLEVIDVKRKSRSGKRSKPDRRRTKRQKKSDTERPSKPVAESSKKTRDTRKAIESAQTAHNQLQPILVTGCTMKDYQLDGLEWLVTLYENGLNGILADEMGLGKTLQCISLICYLLEHKVKGPFLIVAPLSTVNNWCREFERFLPSVDVIKYTGPKDDRRQVTFSKKLRGKVVITSYEIVIKDFSRFSRVSWSYLTVDEGHRLKNFECLLIQKLKRIDAANRLLLTGTPLQNNLNELWSLLNFILPDIFGDLELFQLWFNFEEFTEGNGDGEADKMLKEDVKRKLVQSLHSILKPFLLRRLKANVIRSLPPKKEYIVYADLTPVQRAFYAATVQGDVKASVIELHAKELLLKSYPSLFTKPEHLDIVRGADRGAEIVVNSDSLEEPDGRRLRRNRRQKYSSKLLKKFENDKMRDLEESDEDYYDANDNKEEKGEEDGQAQEPTEEVPATQTSSTEDNQNGGDLSTLATTFENGGENGNIVVPQSLKSHESLEGEALEKEVEKQTAELERTLMMSMAAEGGEDATETAAENGAVLEFHPKDQEVVKVNTTSREWIPYAPSGRGNGALTKADVRNGGMKKKLQRTLRDVLLNGKSDGPEKRGRGWPKGSTARARKVTQVLSSDSDSDVEVIEIQDDSDLSDDERRKVLCEDAYAVAKRHAISLHLQNTAMQLRKICGSHYTFYEPYVIHTNLDDIDDIAVNSFLEKIVKHSGKIKLFEQLLDRLLNDGHKVLVFSQFQKMLDVLEIVLSKKDIPFNRLDGSTSQDEREEAMNEFKEKGEDSSKVFLLSTRAGGLGLNLVSADTVILFDSDWNPQMDIQAIDRLHRIGQTKPIKIFRLVVRDTIEELLIVKSFSKRLLERMVIQLGEFQLGKVAKKLAEENIDLEKFTSMTSIVDIGNRLNLHGAHEVEFIMEKSSNFLLAPPTLQEPLTDAEMEELMDRSLECYSRNPLETSFPNVVPFEATNNVNDE